MIAQFSIIALKVQPQTLKTFSPEINSNQKVGRYDFFIRNNEIPQHVVKLKEAFQ
tara:strand:- start:117 stop:281 length:165 start_codon:yes stop_codon:yes gene_type:complete